MAQIQYGPVSKFPGLTSEEIDRLEKYTANLTGVAKLQEQYKLYDEVINYKQKEQYNKDRAAAINEISYRGVKSNNSTERKKSSAMSRQEILADTAKEYYGLPYDTNTNTVLQGVIKDAQLKGVSPDLLTRYVNSGDESFLYEMGYKEESTAKNILGGLVDSFTTDFMKGGANIAAWVDKKLGTDEEVVEQKRQNAINKIEGMMNVGQNKESAGYNVANIAGDLGQLVVGEGEIKLGAKAATKAVPFLEKLAKLGKTADDLIKEAPILGKVMSFGAKKSAQGVADTILYNALNGEGTSVGEMGEGAAINTALGVAGKLVPTKKGTQKLAKKLEVQGLVNGDILKAVNEELAKAGSAELDGVQSAGNWLLNRKIGGSREEVKRQLSEYADVFRKAKDEVLNLSSSTTKSESTEKALKFLKEEFENELGNEEIAAGLKAIENKDLWSAQEIYNVEKLFDNATNMYKKSTELKAGTKNIGFDTIRKGMKKDIEELIEKDGLGNMKAINNEIQVAKTLEKGISGKLYSEEAQSIVPKSYSSFVGSLLDISGFPRIMRGTANLLSKFSGMEKKTIASKLDEVGNFNEDFLKQVIPESKRESFVNAFKDLVGKEKTTLATRKTQVVPKQEIKGATQKSKSSKNTDIKSIIRKFLLTQTEETMDE